jgi:hypothetical protein
MIYKKLTTTPLLPPFLKKFLNKTLPVMPEQTMHMLNLVLTFQIYSPNTIKNLPKV